MGFAELIETMNKLPADKQAEVIDFAQFVASKYQQLSEPVTTVSASLISLMKNPVISSFEPMTREDANAR